MAARGEPEKAEKVGGKQTTAEESGADGPKRKKTAEEMEKLKAKRLRRLERKRRQMADMESRVSAKRARADSISSQPDSQIAMFREDMRAKAERFLHVVFPEKILLLHNMSKELQTCSTSVQKFTAISPSAADRKPQPMNDTMVDIYSKVKAEVREMISMIGIIITWVKLQRPRIEDGNNFGVEVQMEVLGSLETGFNSAKNVLDTIPTAFFRRGGLVRAVEKHVGLEDYVSAVTALDEKQLYEAGQIVADVQMLYSQIMDKLRKNWSRVENPKGTAPQAGTGTYVSSFYS
eukprot:g2954.t1